MTAQLGESQSWEDAQLAIIAQDHHLLNAFQTLKYVNIALLTILIYDHCLTFDLERRRIWTLKWKLPKCLFIFNRYILPPIFFFEGFSNTLNVGQKICDVRIFMPIPRTAAIMTVELMLILRVLALYENSLALARFLVIQFVIQIILGSCFLGILLSGTRSIAGQNVFTGCLYDLPNWASLTWIPLLAVEAVLVVLTIYKCRKYGEFTPTIKVLARDSTIYFVSISGIVIFNIVYAYQYKYIGMALSLPTSVLTSIAAARLSMNIRSITVERGIATLANQTHLLTLSLSRSSRNAGDNGASSVIAISSRTGVPARQDSQEEWELEGDHFDDDEKSEGPGWWRDENEAIGQGDTRIISAHADDMSERAAV